jgi:tetratricopeptide (TPR) repeat protein
MDLADCYRLLGLRTGASYEDIKASYRRLARQYHPDANPANQQRSQEKFIQLTEAYKALIGIVRPSSNPTVSAAQSNAKRKQPRERPASPSPPVSDPVTSSVKTPRTPPIQTDNLSTVDQKLKAESYQQLEQLLKQQRFPRAVALIEGLAQRLPHDPEVRQWQAITYQRFGRYLANNREVEKAKIYLQKALRADPHNKALWYEVERDMRRVEQIEIF